MGAMIGASMTTIKGDIVIDRELPASHLARCYLDSATSMLPAGAYDVEVTLTPRRWAPDGYHWEGDELQRHSDNVRFSIVDSCCGLLILGQAIWGRDLVPAVVFRAFEKAGLL